MLQINQEFKNDVTIITTDVDTTKANFNKIQQLNVDLKNLVKSKAIANSRVDELFIAD